MLIEMSLLMVQLKKKYYYIVQMSKLVYQTFRALLKSIINRKKEEYIYLFLQYKTITSDC